jgi:hypothetical protein
MFCQENVVNVIGFSIDSFVTIKFITITHKIT